MDAQHCRSKANEFWEAAKLCRDNVEDRFGWMLLAKIWASLADHLDQPATALAKRPTQLPDRLCARLNLRH
jgi:hypothetical protein